MRRPTLGQMSIATTCAVVLIVAAAMTMIVRKSHAIILASSNRQRDDAAARIDASVARVLEHAGRAMEDIERGIHAGSIRVTDEASLEADLFTRALNDEHLEEITFTGATLVGYDGNGDAELAPGGRFQLAVYRTEDGRLPTRMTKQVGRAFVMTTRDRPKGGGFSSGTLVPAGNGADPTAHNTFSVLAAEDHVGRAAWSDLQYSELDQALPVAQQRPILTVQKPIFDGGKFLGVLRVGLLTRELDAVGALKVDDVDPEDPQRIALFAVATPPEKGVHLVARLDPGDRFSLFGTDLRIVSDHLPPEIAALLASPLVAALDPVAPSVEGVIVVNGEPWRATLRALSVAEGGTEGWLVAVLVPEIHYTRHAVRTEHMFLLAFGITLALVAATFGAMLLAVRRGLGKIVATTTKMRSFDFDPVQNSSAFRDVEDVMTGLERAKTVVRTMGKYIPMPLVRRLYDSNSEPELGGVPCDVSIMFTDIEGFTTLSEKLPPDELARRLGDYLEAMTVAIEKTGGTIDKYIGDAVMALWNVPTKVDGHATRACRAALDCMDAARTLYASEAWAGLPPMVTRFGLHRARVLVGHFGAPTRLSFTALGDGVNLAARLEPLCKQYDIVTLVSEDIARAAESAFVFRRIDRVAVKGKTRGVDVYELLGAKEDAIDASRLERARVYEEAFEAYLNRDFDRAIALLHPQESSDPPSAKLIARCHELSTYPPPDAWDGVWVAHSK